MKKRILTLITSLAMLLAMAPAAMAAPALTDLTYEAGEGACISLQEVPGQTGSFLFLPSSADLSALTLRFDGGSAIVSAGWRSYNIASGMPFDLTVLYPVAPADGIYQVTVSQGYVKRSVKIMVSQSISSMYITSADPVNKGRAYVEESKSNKASGWMTLLRADGSQAYAGELSQIKGRGNSTWEVLKKPYQIKLGKKFDLLENGEAAKTWVLLANYYDEALIRNSLVYDLAAEFGLAYSPNNRPIDLYYDGEYRGTYLLSEKTEIGSTRVDIHDLEEDFEDVNPQVNDFDGLPTAMGTNAYGNRYQYVTGLNDPPDITGGYLLEFDSDVNAKAEKSYFVTRQGYYIVSKSPEYLSENAVEYISGFYQEFEDAVLNGGVNPNTGKSYTDYVDLESLVKNYLILELSQDKDAFQTSTFFYKPAGEDKLYAGPVWDFDFSFGNTYLNIYLNCRDTDLVAGCTPIGRALLAIPSFRQAVEDVYHSQLDRLVTDVVLSTDPSLQAGRLRSIAGYSAEIAASWRMNDVLYAYLTGPGSLTAAVEAIQTFLSVRNRFLCDLQWLDENFTVPRFIDVPLDAWYYSAVEHVVNKGLFSGITISLFYPNETMNRAMFATVLHRLAGTPAAAAAAQFTDVAEGQWYSNAVAWAAEQGYMYGVGEGVFDLEGAITLEQMLTVLHRYSGAPAAGGGTGDAYGPVSDWAVDSAAWAVDAGLLSGVGGTLLAQSPASRAQVAAILQRLILWSDTDS